MQQLNNNLQASRRILRPGSPDFCMARLSRRHAYIKRATTIGLDPVSKWLILNAQAAVFFLGPVK